MDFESIKGRVTELAQTGAAMAKEMAEISKLKVNSAAEQDAIRKAYIELGKLYYAEHAADAEAPYAALCEKITASKEKIEYNKQKIADIKAAGSAKTESAEAEVEAEAPAAEAPVCEEPVCEAAPEAPACEEPAAPETPTYYEPPTNWG